VTALRGPDQDAGDAGEEVAGFDPQVEECHLPPGATVDGRHQFSRLLGGIELSGQSRILGAKLVEPSLEAAMRRRVIVALLTLPALSAVVWPNAVHAADPPMCLGQPATIAGSVEADELHGTDGPDVMWGGAGRDRIYGYAGDDLICLGEPTDDAGPPSDFDGEIAEGGRGNDRIVGPPGDSWVTGGPGADEIWTSVDPATKRPSKGIDQFYGGVGADIMHGTDSDDVLIGGSGADRIFALAGQDFLKGGGGPNRLFGGDGDDDVWGGRGDDRLEGGSGDDEIQGDRPAPKRPPDWFGDDVLLGGDGRDELFGMGGTNRNDGGDGIDGCMDPADGDRAKSCERVLTLADLYDTPDDED
jgi:Ca2+-binding RTX toxin-like protein